MLELEALGLTRISTELSVQYVDHNLLQTDEKNPEDHLFYNPVPPATVCGFPNPVMGCPIRCTRPASAVRAPP